MIKKEVCWVTDDGVPHLSEEAAKDHAFKKAITLYVDGIGLDDDTACATKDRLFNDRFRLLGIYKILNGGPTPGEAAAPTAILPQPIASGELCQIDPVNRPELYLAQ